MLAFAFVVLFLMAVGFWLTAEAVVYLTARP